MEGDESQEAQGCDLPQAGTTARVTHCPPGPSGRSRSRHPSGKTLLHTPQCQQDGQRCLPLLLPSPRIFLSSCSLKGVLVLCPWQSGDSKNSSEGSCSPTPHCPQDPPPSSLVSLAGPATSKGRGEAHLYWGPGNGVEQENPRHEHPGHDSILNLPEAEQECHTEGHKVQPCKREKPGSAVATGPSVTAPALRAEPGCTRVVRNPFRAGGSGQLQWSCGLSSGWEPLERGRELLPLHNKGLRHRWRSHMMGHSETVMGHCDGTLRDQDGTLRDGGGSQPPPDFSHGCERIKG